MLSPSKQRLALIETREDLIYVFTSDRNKIHPVAATFYSNFRCRIQSEHKKVITSYRIASSLRSRDRKESLKALLCCADHYLQLNGTVRLLGDVRTRTEWQWPRACSGLWLRPYQSIPVSRTVWVRIVHGVATEPGQEWTEEWTGAGAHRRWDRRVARPRGTAGQIDTQHGRFRSQHQSSSVIQQQQSESFVLAEDGGGWSRQHRLGS